MKHALITGIAGQDGSYLAELLLSKGYKVYGLSRPGSKKYDNIKHILGDITIIEGDITDYDTLVNAMTVSKPDEIYNLAAQSFVGVSWKKPRVTGQINAMGVTNILEAIHKTKPDARFYQASTSEMYGHAQKEPHTEHTPFYPKSPYGVAKLYGHWITKNYRESFKLFACSGILCNHESERRGPEFVTRKITQSVVKIKHGIIDKLELGNLEAARDWGHAEDYVEVMWLMLQQDVPDDYVIASGEIHTVREFVEIAFSYIGIDIEWKGTGLDEVGIDKNTGKVLVCVNPIFFRPVELEVLTGDPTKAENKLGWKRKVPFDILVKRMIESDLKAFDNKRNDSDFEV